ncbi:MAG TPA: hypothetical protein EYP24_01220 [bacterium (Candidatus Stahlbacteria)]|nr:hypothetical protein [Candidatus Stahlbacteria bacterium]
MHYISRSNLENLITRIAETWPVYLPFMSGEKANYHRYEGNLDHDGLRSIRPTASVKNFLFPPSEYVGSFPKEVRKSIPDQVVIGPKRCDIFGVEVFDHVFAEGEFKDPFYLERKDKLLIISADCPQPKESCFCNLLDLRPYVEKGSDLNLIPLDDGYLIETLSKKGETCLKDHTDLLREPTDGEEKQKKAIRSNAEKILEDQNRGKISGPVPEEEKFWKEKVDGCVECFACLFACPTCYCFLLYDAGVKKGFDRVRIWDACYYAAYARVGGGMNPRPDFLSRFKNRFLCKFDYFKRYYGVHACSGCGRCLKGCSANIDIREVMWR